MPSLTSQQASPRKVHTGSPSPLSPSALSPPEVRGRILPLEADVGPVRAVPRRPPARRTAAGKGGQKRAQQRQVHGVGLAERGAGETQKEGLCEGEKGGQVHGVGLAERRAGKTKQ